MSDLAAAEEVARAATPGQWLHGRNGMKNAAVVYSPGHPMEWRSDENVYYGVRLAEADATFIATWNPKFALDLLALLRSKDERIEELAAAEEVARAATPRAVSDGALEFWRLLPETMIVAPTATVTSGGLVSSPSFGLLAPFIARIDAAEALLRSKDERIEELEGALTVAGRSMETYRRRAEWAEKEITAIHAHLNIAAALASTPDDQPEEGGE